MQFRKYDHEDEGQLSTLMIWMEVLNRSLSVNLHMGGKMYGSAWNRFGFRATQRTSKQLTLKLDMESFDHLEFKGLHMSLANMQMYIKT